MLAEQKLASLDALAARHTGTSYMQSKIDVDIRNMAHNFTNEQVRLNVELNNDAKRLAIAEERIIEMLITERSSWKKKMDSAMKEMERQRKERLNENDRVLNVIDSIVTFLKACGYSTNVSETESIVAAIGNSTKLLSNLEQAAQELCEVVRYVMEERNQCILALSFTDEELTKFGSLSDAIHGRFGKLEQEILDLQQELKDREIEIKDLEAIVEDQGTEKIVTEGVKKNKAPPVTPVEMERTISNPLLSVRKIGQKREFASSPRKEKLQKDNVRIEIHKGKDEDKSQNFGFSDDQDVVVVHDIQSVVSDHRVVVKPDSGADSGKNQYALTGFRTRQNAADVPIRLIAEIQPLKDLEQSRSLEQMMHELRVQLKQLEDSYEEKSKECEKYKQHIKTLKHMYHFGTVGGQHSAIAQMMINMNMKEGFQNPKNRRSYQPKTGNRKKRKLPTIDRKVSKSTDSGLITSSNDNLLSLLQMAGMTENAKFPPAKTAVSRCLRCQRLYRLQDNHKRACRYHPKGKKKIEKYNNNGKLMKVMFAWDCCNHEAESPGCCADEHI